VHDRTQLVQAAYGDTSAFRATLNSQAAMFLQQTSQGACEEVPQAATGDDSTSDAWLEVTRPMQLLAGWMDGEVCFEASSHSPLQRLTC
jgi:hypothetical protein